MRVKLTLAYCGTAYSGWQIQEKPNPPPTIQGAVETALFSLLGRHIRVHGAGRTDAGVHAFGQVAHFDIDRQPLPWQKALNSVLPHDIRVIDARESSPSFHARNDAVAKTYFYNLWQDPKFVPPTLSAYVWSCGQISTEAVREAMLALKGCHDFASFQNHGTPVKTTIREIYDISLSAIEHDYWISPLPGLRITITANGFLKQMARNIAGYLIYVGKGRLSPADLDGIFTARQRQALSSPTAPACGLSLSRVFYEPPTINARG